ncbi:hypothetical protein WNY61_18760 [Sulfitobacter sp. AS92]|uniref:hypothetical protein n=1 Tax=Sulfitobacter sp. AS92 TaxID=3135783 RepID=UPI00317E7200
MSKVATIGVILGYYLGKILLSAEVRVRALLRQKKLDCADMLLKIQEHFDAPLHASNLHGKGHANQIGAAVQGAGRSLEGKTPWY